MTKEQILALIDAKIAGQGTNIDAGSALPEILSGILGLIPDGALTTSPQELTDGQQEQVLENLALTDVLRSSEQSLTDAQKEQARTNIGVPTQVQHEIEIVGTNPDSEQPVDRQTFKTYIKIDGEQLPDLFDWNTVTTDWKIKYTGSQNFIGEFNISAIQRFEEAIKIFFGSNLGSSAGITGALLLYWGDVEYYSIVSEI